jgi:hypothetical protein
MLITDDLVTEIKDLEIIGKHIQKSYILKAEKRKADALIFKTEQQEEMEIGESIVTVDESIVMDDSDSLSPQVEGLATKLHKKSATSPEE